MKKKILRITSEWKVYHLEYYLNGFADYIVKIETFKDWLSWSNQNGTLKIYIYKKFNINLSYLSSVVFKSVVTNRRGPSLSNTRDFPEDRTPHLKLKEAPLICRALLVFKLESSTNCSIIVVWWGTTGRSHVSPV